MEVILVGNTYDSRFNTGYAGNVYSPKGICPTIRTPSGGGNMPMVIVWTKCDGGNI